MNRDAELAEKRAAGSTVDEGVSTARPGGERSLESAVEAALRYALLLLRKYSSAKGRLRARTGATARYFR